MTNIHTTLREILQIPFLKRRVDKMVGAILKEPDRVVIWIGAGLSAKYGRFPTWTQFLRNLVDEIRRRANGANQDLTLVENLINAGRLSIAAELLSDSAGEDLRAYLVEKFSKPSGRMPQQLGYLNARDIITTNYDTLLSDLLPWYKEVYPADGLEHLISDDFKIVKIHGSVLNPSSCVLSTSHYANAYTPNLYWYLANILSNNTVVFLGSSMNAAEPYFKTLRFLKQNRRLTRSHYAIKSISDDEQGRIEGKRLGQFGIELIPYIADDNHTFVDEIFEHLDSLRGSPQALEVRLQAVRRRLEEGELFHAVALLWHASHAQIEHRETRRALGDAVSEFFEVAASAPEPEKDKLMQLVRDNFDLAQIWERAALDFSVLSMKSIQGFQRSLKQLEELTGRPQPLLRQRLNEATDKFKKSSQNGKTQ
jgi:SIR2-like domain